MTYHEILIPSIVTLAGVFGGMYAGYLLTIKNEKQKETQTLEKIKYLINADYTLIYRQAKEGKEYHSIWYDNIINLESLVYYTASLDLASQFLVELGIRHSGFTYWDSISTSGNLINLEPDELRLITSSHLRLTNIVNYYQNSFDRLKINLLKEIVEPQLPSGQKVGRAKMLCRIYFPVLFEAYDKILENIEIMKNNISWIDLKAEPILQFKAEPKKTEGSQIYVREDGITVYPNGMEVDKKGTILNMGT